MCMGRRILIFPASLVLGLTANFLQPKFNEY
jgi:hypothetical protein